MTDKDTEHEERPRVKVTDRRRVHTEALEGTPQPEGAAAPGGEEPSTATELDTAKKQAAEYLDHLQRLQAEFANYRKRVIKEQTRAMEMAAEPFVRKLLEVLDEFDLALMAAERSPDFERFLHGVELVYANLLDILRSEGLERIDAEGKAFDPEHHEALMQSGGSEGEPFVADILRQGYTMKGRVIRPAGVKVMRR
jgi:molecular chaperone GrpE